MVGLRRVAGGGADALVGLADQLVGREGLVGRVAPELAADALVHEFGEGFGETVGKRLDQDRGVVVVTALEALGDLLLLDAGGDDEAAHIVGLAAIERGDEIGERHARLVAGLAELLAQGEQRCQFIAALVIGEQADVLADGVGNSIRTSIVAKQEFAGYWEYLLDEAIFTAPAHPSWGGAALIGADGALLGIGSLRLQMISDGEVADINMSVPIDLLPPILDDLLTRGEVDRPPRPWLGVFSAESDGQVVVMSVADGSPADRAGLQRGDVISDIRDTEVGGLADFYRKLWDTGPAGAELPIRIVRDGRESWIRLKSADRNSFLKKPLLQ